MQFVSSQSNSRNGIHSKCCFMEVIGKTGCSLRKGKMECLHLNKTLLGQQGDSWAQGKVAFYILRRDLTIFVTLDKISHNLSSLNMKQIPKSSGVRVVSSFTQATLHYQAGSDDCQISEFSWNAAQIQKRAESKGKISKLTVILLKMRIRWCQ